MKKRSLFTCLIALTAAFGFANIKRNDNKAARAEDAAVYTLTPAAGSNNSYAANCDITIGGITWNVAGNASLIPWRIGGKSLSNVSRSVYSKTAIEESVTKVDLEVGAASNITVSSISLKVYSNMNDGLVCTVEGTFAANSTISFSKPVGANWTNRFYSFDFVVSVSGTSNKFVEFKEAVFYGEESGGGSVVSDEDIAANVDTLIGNIGTVSMGKADLVKAAREAYDDLTDAQKVLVTKLEDLEAAEQYLDKCIIFSNSLQGDATSTFSNIQDTWNVPVDFNISDFTNCYNGKCSSIKLGSGSANGSFVVSLSDKLASNNIISSVTVCAAKYGSDTGVITVKGNSVLSDRMSLAADKSEHCFDVSSQKVTSVTIGTSEKRANIYGVKVEYDVGGATLNSALNITGSLNKTSYFEKETLSLDGLTINASYSDGSYVDVTNNVTLGDDGVLTTGQTSVSVTYKSGTETATGTISGFTVSPYMSVDYGRIGHNESFGGEYFIAYVNESSAKVWNCNLTDADNSYIDADVVDNKISSTKPLEDCIVTVTPVLDSEENVTGYSLMVPTGKYVSFSSDKLSSSDTAVLFDIDCDFDVNGYVKLSPKSKTSNNVICFNTSSNKLRYYAKNSSSVSYVTLFKKGSAPTATGLDLFDLFVAKYMHFVDVATTVTSDTGACRGDDGYFALASSAFNALTPAQRNLIMEGQYTDVFNRLSAWADANGKTIDFDADSNVAIMNRINSRGYSDDSFSFGDEDSNAVVLGVTGLSAAALGVLYLLKKKRVSE